MALAPISFGNQAIAQTFEKLFEGDSYVPYLYADINDDGKPGEFLGWYEILDTGGNEGIRNGSVLDIWMPTYEECIQFGRKDVLVVFVEGVG